MLDFSRFKALTFDCYGTLIDWETGITDFTRARLAGDAALAAPDLILSSFAVSQAKHQQIRPALLYPEVLRRTWQDMEGTFGWEPDPANAQAFGASVGDWPAFPDTVESLKTLGQHYKLAILSNVDNASLEKSKKKLVAPFTFTVTAEDVGSYKPGLPHFERAFALFKEQGIGKDQILHVGQSKHHDVNPGRALGLTTVWVNRRHGKRGSGATLATDAQPDLTVTSMAELASAVRSQIS